MQFDQALMVLGRETLISRKTDANGIHGQNSKIQIVHPILAMEEGGKITLCVFCTNIHLFQSVYKLKTTQHSLFTKKFTQEIIM
jgi:hypothetical protein